MTAVVQHPAGPAQHKGARGSGMPVAPSPRRLPRLRARLRRAAARFDLVGVVVGLAAFLLSLTPSLLPRMWGVQGVISGLAAAVGYALGVAVAWLGRGLRIPALPAHLRRWAWWTLAVVAAVSVPAMLWLGATWQNDIRRSLGAPVASRASYIGVLFVAAAVALALIGIGRLFGRMYVALTRRLSGVGPPLAATSLAALAVAALAFALGYGVVYRGSLFVADRIFTAYDRGDNPGVVATTSSLRSGGPGSLVPWTTLGRQGRAFIATGPTVADIEELTHRPAVAPIRVYAGVGSAPNLHAEAQLVLAELKRTGAFDRSLLAVAGTTGSGGVEGQLADPLEYMYGGNTAIAAMQYSRLPSWIAFVVDHAAAREAGRVLFDTVYDYWSTLPAGHRPRLVVFGESMGAYSIAAAFTGVADLERRTSGALFSGPPNQTELWRDVTTARAAGSPQRLPVYGDGGTVQFAANAADLRDAGGSLRHPEVVFVQHASDPYLWWSTSLAWHRPDWLRERHGDDVTPHMRWIPLLTFWQVSADLAIRGHVAPGHGHHYGPEIPTAWAAILQPPHWTDEETVALLPKVMFPD
jgi:uncharacterized membrane protein